MNDRLKSLTFPYPGKNLFDDRLYLRLGVLWIAQASYFFALLTLDLCSERMYFLVILAYAPKFPEVWEFFYVMNNVIILTGSFFYFAQLSLCFLLLIFWIQPFHGLNLDISP